MDQNNTSAPRHTEGPWRIRSTGRDSVIEADEPSGVSAAPVRICVVTCGDFTDLTGSAKRVNDANAHLIAAAPELKDRLIELLDMLDGGASLDTGPARRLLDQISEGRS